MRHRYHVQTPFSRPQNLAFYLDRLEPLGITWHPIFDADQKEKVGPFPAWVKPLFCPPTPDKWFAGNFKSNWFVLHGEYTDSDRLVLINDDDWIEPGFLEKVDKVEGEFLIVSMKRGDHPATTGYETFTLHAKGEHLRHGGVGGEQIILSGRMQRQYRWGSEQFGDWTMLSAILAEHKPAFVPDAFSWFNYLEPGRWNEVKL